MLIEKIYMMSNYLKSGFYNPYNYEITLKVYLIYIFSAISLFIFLVLGTNCLYEENTFLGTILLSGAGLFFFNILYLKLTDDYTTSSYIILYFLFALMLYLVYSGGVQQTGSMWSFILPPVILFIHGLKKGLTELFLFLLIVASMLFVENGSFLETTYTYAFKVRLVLILFVTIMLSALYQYTREVSMKRMIKMQSDLEFFLRRDPLTGLYNRRGYDYNIKHIESAEYGAILMCDIDHFKKINDTYGHSAGDCVLQVVANVIKENIRIQDFSVRWGGEEFFIFLSTVTSNEAYNIAEKLRRKIENTPIRYHDKMINVTMSIGISIVEKDIPLSEAIKNADNAMYLSKSRGRNKTTRP